MTVPSCKNQDARRKPAFPARKAAADAAAFLAAIGREVRRNRAKRGMTRRQLAQASQTSERYLAQIESGAGNPSASVLRAIAQALDLPAAALVAGGRRAHRGARRHPRSGRAGAGRRIAGARQGDRGARRARRRRRPRPAHRAGRPARRRQVDARPDAGAASRLAVHRARPRASRRITAPAFPI